MDYSRDELEFLAIKEAPPLDPEFLAYEKLRAARPGNGLPDAIEDRQPAYAQQCRDLLADLTKEGARDHHLSQGIIRTWTSVKSSLDGYEIPVMQLDLVELSGSEPDIVIIYYHGGGLAIGEADSEELSCRRIVKSGLGRIRMYSVGYRLKFPYGAKTSVADSVDCFNHFKDKAGKIIVAGSSSGGQLAATVSQYAPQGSIHGVLLRGPVTGDAHSSIDLIPERVRRFHTSVAPSFLNSISSYLIRDEPRDGLDTLPIEADHKTLAFQPKTWIQVSTNDTLYSDGLCYAMVLKECGVDVRLDVIYGWPHTFWLIAPELPQSLKADEDMIQGLRWLLD